MKKSIHLFGITLLTGWLLSACDQPSAKQQEPENKAVPTEMKPAASSITIDPKLLAVSNDVVCGMPISEGISDTLTYEGKLYGFCSSECKDAFHKSPAQYLSAK